MKSNGESGGRIGVCEPATSINSEVPRICRTRVCSSVEACLTVGSPDSPDCLVHATSPGWRASSRVEGLFALSDPGSGEVEPRAGLDAGAGERPALIDGHQRGEGFAGLVRVLTACLGLGGLRKVADLGRLPASLGPDGQTGRARHKASSSNPATRGEERPSSGVAISR